MGLHVLKETEPYFRAWAWIDCFLDELFGNASVLGDFAFRAERWRCKPQCNILKLCVVVFFYSIRCIVIRTQDVGERNSLHFFTTEKKASSTSSTELFSFDFLYSSFFSFIAFIFWRRICKLRSLFESRCCLLSAKAASAFFRMSLVTCRSTYVYVKSWSCTPKQAKDILW